MPDKWGRITGTDWMQLANGLSALQGISQREKGLRLEAERLNLANEKHALDVKAAKQNQLIRESTINDIKRQDRISAYTTTALNKIKESGEVGIAPEGANALEWTKATSLAYKAYNDSEAGRALAAENNEKRLAKAYAAFVLLQTEIREAIKNGQTSKVKKLTEHISEIANTPLKVKWNDKTQKFDKYYKHSGSGKWEKTGTVAYGNLVPELANMTREKFTNLDIASNQAVTEYNLAAWGILGQEEGGRTQIYVKDGQEFLVTPQRSKDNMNEIHYIVTDANNRQAKFNSKQSLLKSGFRYDDTGRRKTLADIQRIKELSNYRKAQRLAVSSNKTTKPGEVYKPSAEEYKRAERDYLNAIPELLSKYENLGPSFYALQNTQPVMDGEEPGRLINVQNGSLEDVKKALGTDYIVSPVSGKIKFKTPAGKVVGRTYKIIPRQESVVRQGKKFANISSFDPVKAAAKVASDVDSNFNTMDTKNIEQDEKTSGPTPAKKTRVFKSRTLKELQNLDPEQLKKTTKSLELPWFLKNIKREYRRRNPSIKKPDRALETPKKNKAEVDKAVEQLLEGGAVIQTSLAKDIENRIKAGEKLSETDEIIYTALKQILALRNNS